MILAAIGYVGIAHQDLSLPAEQLVQGLYDNFIILAVPLFIVAANIMNAGSISDRLLKFCVALVGRFRGGLGLVNVVANIIFAGMSGSAVADAAGLGKVIIDMMRKDGRYPPAYAAAITAAASTIGPIIPPSIPMVMYSLVSGASIGALFLGGILPGLLMGLMLMGMNCWAAKRRNFGYDEPVPIRELPRLTVSAFPALLMPAILLYGIYGGVTTPTEAAAVAAFYALLLAALFYRALSLRSLYEVLRGSVMSSASVGLVIGGALIFNYIVASENVPSKMAAFIDGVHVTPHRLHADRERAGAAPGLPARRVDHHPRHRAALHPVLPGDGHRSRLFRRRHRRELHDRPDHPALRHRPLRAERHHRHPAEGHDPRGLDLRPGAGRGAPRHDPRAGYRALAAAHARLQGLTMTRVKLGLIGGNIRASRAPALHRIAGRLAGLEVTYDLLIPAELGLDLDGTLAKARAEGYRGLNITYPFKETAVARVRVEDPAIRRLGAVNTVLFDPESPQGFNTDYTGFMAAFRATFGSARPGVVAIAGTGGVGRAIGFALAGLGAAELRLYDRERAKTEALAAALGGFFPDMTVRVCSSIEDAARGADGLVNGTPQGMVGLGARQSRGPHRRPALGLRCRLHARRHALPRRRPRRRHRRHERLRALFHQGVDAFRIFTGRDVDQAVLRRRLMDDEG